MKGQYPSVAAVVLNWNALDETVRCMESLTASDWPQLTTIVVDNASREDIEPTIRGRFPSALFLRNPANVGFAGGMNAGLRRALELGVEYVLLLNNDTRLDPAMVRILVETAVAHPDAGMVCPLVLYRDSPDTVLSAGLKCDLRRGYQGRAWGMGQRDRGQFDLPREVAAPSGAAMLVPATVVRQIGMLDEHLFLYGEDVEWAQRMRTWGLRVYVAGRARLWHGLSTSSGGACSPLSSYYQTRNSFVVCARYVPMQGPRSWMRGADILLANLLYVRRARSPMLNLRAVLAGWRDYKRGRLGPCPHEAFSVNDGVAACAPSRSPGSVVSDARQAIVVSAGFSKTHMTTAAREILARGQLAFLVTGAYPTPRFQAFVRRTSFLDRGRLARMLDRDEHISGERLRVHAFSEVLFEAGRLIGRLAGGELAAEPLCAATWRLYGWLAARDLRRTSLHTRVYHFRAGFGQASITAARERGMYVLCDQAIVHPSLLEELIETRGRSLAGAPRACSTRDRAPRSSLERAILRDIERSDSVLVNSEFVKQTFLACGWPPERVHVVYLGVDDNFLRAVDNNAPPAAGEMRDGRYDGPLRLLFAGRLERRKGADVLVEALSRVRDEAWEIVIAGPVAADVLRQHRRFLDDRRVTLLGPIRRAELARQMLEAPVFIFPSYAEGSARVVFEALACGCYVITTPNSGTIVEDGVHGALVQSGDVEGLAAAIVAAARDRQRLAKIAARNAALIRAHYRQFNYGEGLVALYDQVVSSPIRPPALPRAAHR